MAIIYLAVWWCVCLCKGPGLCDIPIHRENTNIANGEIFIFFLLDFLFKEKRVPGIRREMKKSYTRLSQKFLIQSVSWCSGFRVSFYQLIIGQFRDNECPGGLELPAGARNRGKATLKIRTNLLCHETDHTQNCLSQKSASILIYV